MSEDARAAAYRAQAERRAVVRASLEAALAAPETEAIQVREAWEPVQEQTRHGDYERPEERIEGVANS
jgi:hypothetical protein